MRARSTILGFAALTILLTAGAAQSLSGTNTVFSDDIVDGTIVTTDLKPNSVSGGRILDNSITGADVNESTIPGFKKVYFARVMFVFPEGNESSHEVRLYGGNATAVAMDETTFEFKVTFPFSVTACAPSVTSGTVPGLVPPEIAMSNPNAPSAFTTLKTAEPQVVSVKFKQDDGTSPTVDSFSLTLVCP